MDLDFIPRKTEKGRAEMLRRTFQVTHRERSVLIMVDGKTPASLLLAKLAFIDRANEILAELRDGGFIDFDGPDEPPPLGTSATSASGMPLTDELLHWQQFARTFIVEALGSAGDGLAARLEACQSREELLSLLEECRRYLEACVSRNKAQEFWNALGDEVLVSPVLVER